MTAFLEALDALNFHGIETLSLGSRKGVLSWYLSVEKAVEEGGEEALEGD